MSISKEVGKSCSAFDSSAEGVLGLVLVLVLRNGREEDEAGEEEGEEGDACHCRCCRLGPNGGMLRVLPIKAAVLR